MVRAVRRVIRIWRIGRIPRNLKMPRISVGGRMMFVIQGRALPKHKRNRYAPFAVKYSIKLPT